MKIQIYYHIILNNQIGIPFFKQKKVNNHNLLLKSSNLTQQSQHINAWVSKKFWIYNPEINPNFLYIQSQPPKLQNLEVKFIKQKIQKQTKQKNQQQNLDKKYQNTKIQQVDINSIHVPKKKRIKKIKEYKYGNLNRKIKRHKLKLNRLWALRLFHFLKEKSNKNYVFRKIKYFKKQMISAPDIIQLSKVFKQHPWVGRILEKQKENFLNFIYEQKISDQTKLVLFQTFDILLGGIKHPENLVSWDLQLNRNTKESSQFLLKFKDKSYEEIHELALQQYSREKEHYQSNKCSPHNNISYYWFKYIKDIFETKEFKSLFQSHQIYRRLQFIFCQSATIMTIRNALSIKQLAQYILNTKIESKQILSQLVSNPKMNLLNKINMVMSLNQFINAVKDPSTLRKWIR